MQGGILPRQLLAHTVLKVTTDSSLHQPVVHDAEGKQVTV